jgi:hypothetical protein
MKQQTFARKCDITGEGMNEGYCVFDGEKYFKYEKDLIKFLRDREESPSDLSDEFLLKEAYDLDEYYYTEWEDDDHQYALVNGQLVEID